MEEGSQVSIGQYLRQEREKRNISLESVALATRITQANLEALERDDFHFFSAPLFIRGFLKTYAIQIGIDPKDVLSLYETQAEFPTEPKKIKGPSRHEWKPRFIYAALLIVIVFGVGLFFFLSPQKKSTSPSPQASPAPPAAPAVLAQPEPSPVQQEVQQNEEPSYGAAIEGKIPEKPTPAASATGDGEKKEKRHVLKIKATQPTWVRIQPDDQPEIKALLKPAETGTWTARRQLKATVGNAGGVEISFNGTPLKNLGESGQVVRLILPKGKKPKEKAKQEL